ncbi:MAG: hypothetical protein J6Q77_02645, partial [Clostridia bacterium]|nr:hypothetical protein [Clostridia bacterium]
GDTQYKESKEALVALEKDSYSVSVVGNKIVVVANNSYLYPIAMQKLVDAVIVNDGTLCIPKDFSYKSESYSAMTLSKSGYRIVYENGNDKAAELANSLKLSLYDAGITVSVVDDSADEAPFEILVGNTNRDLSEYDSGKDFKSAVIKRDNEGNIALTGDFALAGQMFEKFVTRLYLDGKGINLIEPMFGSFFPDGIGRAPDYKGSGEIEWFNSSPLSGSYYMRIHDATKKDYNDYIATLKAEGFEEYYSTTSNGQLFSTWTDGYNIINLSYISYFDEFETDWNQGDLGDISYITVGIDCIENSALPEMSPEIKTLTTPQITTVSSGYVLRLADGRFVCWDGGVDAYADEIYKIITDQNVLPGKPVIAAWFMTHNHTDHMGVIHTFARKYGKQVEIQNFVHNMPGVALIEDKFNWEVNREQDLPSYIARLDVYYNLLSGACPDANIIVARAGQRFLYGDIAIDILFTVENMYKKDLYDGNGASMITSITNLKTEKRMIETGDASITCCALLSGIYEDELKCNIIQVPHHGANGGHYDMYSYAAADIAIWTTYCNADNEFQVTNGRCWFDYRTVVYNVIPSSGQNVTLTESMTLDDVAPFNRVVYGNYEYGRYEGGSKISA